MERRQTLRLCYLDASRVKSPLGNLAALKLETDGQQDLGTLNGVLIDPSERRVCYFVIEKLGWFGSRKYVIPTDCPAWVAPDRSTLRLEVEPDDFASYDAVRDSVHPFSDDDLVDALFAREVA